MKLSDVDKFQKEQGSGPVTKDMGIENDDPAQTYAFRVNPNASVEKEQAWREGRQTSQLHCCRKQRRPGITFTVNGT